MPSVFFRVLGTVSGPSFLFFTKSGESDYNYDLQCGRDMPVDHRDHRDCVRDLEQDNLYPFGGSEGGIFHRCGSIAQTTSYLDSGRQCSI